MRRIKIEIAYDGTKYCGWQFQPNRATVEAVLNKTLSELLGEEIIIIGASRTDAGVHARGNIAVFDTESRMAADKICPALNQRLPDDIRVEYSTEVALDFHPRRVHSKKTYEYQILNRKVDIPTIRFYTHFVYYDLDVVAMQEAAKYLVGRHDFKSFCSVKTQAVETVRTIYELTVTKQEDIITIRIIGNGFLFNMVRIIVGTLLKVGRGACSPENMVDILKGCNRGLAGPTAPAQGLSLMKIEF